MNAAIDMVALSPKVKSFVGQPRQALIDSRWQNAQGGETFEVFDPATETVNPRIVTVAGYDDENAMVLNGVAEGERVVTAGVHKQVAKQKARLLEAKP